MPGWLRGVLVYLVLLAVTVLASYAGSRLFGATRFLLLWLGTIGVLVLLAGLWLLREWFRIQRRFPPARPPPAPVPPPAEFVGRGPAPMPPPPLSSSDLETLRRRHPDGERLAKGICLHCGEPALTLVRVRELATETVDDQGRRGGFIAVQLEGTCGACGKKETVFTRR